MKTHVRQLLNGPKVLLLLIALVAAIGSYSWEGNPYDRKDSTAPRVQPWWTLGTIVLLSGASGLFGHEAPVRMATSVATGTAFAWTLPSFIELLRTFGKVSMSLEFLGCVAISVGFASYFTPAFLISFFMAFIGRKVVWLRYRHGEFDNPRI